MADMVVAAGVDATGYLYLQRADGFGARAIAEALGYPLRDRDRSRRRQRAIVETGAGDDVAHEPRIGRREADRREPVVDGGQVVERDIGQNEILLVRNPELVARIVLRKVRHRVHLVGARVAGNAADRLQRDRDDGIAGDLVRRDVGAHKIGKFCILAAPALYARAFGLSRPKGGRREIGSYPRDFGFRQRKLCAMSRREFRLNRLLQALEPFSCNRILMRALYLLSRRPSRL